jgi:hypothetical protein
MTVATIHEAAFVPSWNKQSPPLPHSSSFWTSISSVKLKIAASSLRFYIFSVGLFLSLVDHEGSLIPSANNSSGRRTLSTYTSHALLVRQLL